MLRDVRDPQRDAVADDRAKQSVALGQGSDASAQVVGDPARDEALYPSPRVDTERRVPGANKIAHAVDDQLEASVDVQLAGDDARRTIQGVEGVVGSHRGEPSNHPGRTGRGAMAPEFEATRHFLTAAGGPTISA